MIRRWRVAAAGLLLAAWVGTSGLGGLTVFSIHSGGSWEPHRDSQILAAMWKLSPEMRAASGTFAIRDRQYALFLSEARGHLDGVERVRILTPEDRAWYRFRAAFVLSPCLVEEAQGPAHELGWRVKPDPQTMVTDRIGAAGWLGRRP